MNKDNKNTEVNDTDKKLHISDVMNSILNELNDKSIEYIKKYECSLYSVGEIDSMTMIYKEQSDAVEECIKIVKKYYS
jgi:hypothetical protein